MDGAGFNVAQILESVGAGGLAERLPDPSDRKSCCALLYELELVRLILGDTLHPGGLALTHRLGKLAGIQKEDRVLDVACGRGTSALAVARSFHCRVLGVDLGLRSIREAVVAARNGTVSGSAAFVAGDAESLPFQGGPFDVALCECSMNLFPEKARGVAEMARLLRPGGRLAVSDVTVEPGCLPDELTGTLGQLLCMADAPSVQGYRDLLDGGGLALVEEQDTSDSLMTLIHEIEAKIAAFRFLSSLQQGAEAAPDLISTALVVAERAKALVEEGGIGYRLFVAEKRG